MCILCSIQKWSRKVATMLPLLVIPLIGLWALSQLFPPAFRFEITSPRLACVAVLVVTLGWYEVLMPRLSSWRARRNARLREKKRFEAIEMHKLRKTATRRCRNCLTPYKDQNPGGAGKFMCSFCGHISKRPILDLPALPGGLGHLSNSGILNDLVGKGGKMLNNGKVWPDNRRWMCGQDWLENGNWAVSNPDSWSKNGGGFFGVDHCLAETSGSRIFAFACKALTAFFFSIMWLCRKVLRISSSRGDASVDAEHGAMMDKGGENGGNCQESRGEKARRKAEEKRLARLEKELVEEEERKQREEVARLVEERRRLRDEKMEAEKGRGKGSPSAKVRESKRGAEKKKQERKKERDRGSSKSNSDVEELDKRQCKEGERNKQSDDDRRQQHKNGPGSFKTHNAELIHGLKAACSSNHSRGNVGTRYLDRMRGTLLSSSRAFTGGGFFGKSTTTSTIPREQKSNSLLEPVYNASRREQSRSDRAPGRLNPSGDDGSKDRPVLIEPQPSTAPKKSWQQLFTRSPTVSPPSSNVISRPSFKHRADILHPPCQPPAPQSFDNPISFGLPSPFTLTSFPCGPTSCSASIPSSPRAIYPRIGEGTGKLLAEECEKFEDPCYVPDPVSLLGPVFESLDDFQQEVDLGFVLDRGLDNPPLVNNVHASSEVTRPSPIESPISRMRAPEERHAGSFFFSNTSNVQDMRTVPTDSSNNANDIGTWQMWNSSPLGQAGLSLIGSPTHWPLSTTSNVPPAPPKTMASLFKNVEQLLPVCQSPHAVFAGSCQNGGIQTTVLPGGAESGHPKTSFGTHSGDENQFSVKHEDAAQCKMMHGSPNAAATNHAFAFSPPNCWAKKDWTLHRSGESVGSSPTARASVGGLYSKPNVQSLWSYE